MSAEEVFPRLLAEKDRVINQLETDNQEYEKTVQSLADQLEHLTACYEALQSKCLAAATSGPSPVDQGQTHPSSAPAADRRIAASSSATMLAVVASLEKDLKQTVSENVELRERMVALERAADSRRRDLECGQLLVSEAVQFLRALSPTSPVSASAPKGGSFADALERVLSEMQRKLRRQEKELAETAASNDRLKSEIIRMSDSLSELSQESMGVAALRAEHESLQNLYCDLRLKADTLVKEAEEMQQALQARSSERDDLSAKLQASQQEAKNLTAKLLATHEETVAIQQLLLEAASQKDSLVRTVEESQRQAATMTDEAAEIRQLIQVRNDELEQVRGELKDSLALVATSQGTIDHLLAEAADLEAALDREKMVSSKVGDLQVRLDQLLSDREQYVAERKDLYSRHADTSRKLEMSVSLVGDLQSQVETLKGENARLLDDRERLRATLQELDALYADNKSLRLSIAEAGRERERLNRELAETQRRLSLENDELRSELERAKLRSSAVDMENEALVRKVELIDADLKAAQQQSVALLRTKTELEQEVHHLIVDRTRYQEAAILWSRLQPLLLEHGDDSCPDPEERMRDLVAKSRALSDVQMELDNAREQLSALIAQHASKSDEIARLLRDLETKENAEAEASQFKEMARQATVQHERLVREYRIVGEERDRWRRDCQLAAAELEARTRDLAAANNERNTVRSECAELRKQIVKYLRLAGMVQEDAVAFQMDRLSESQQAGSGEEQCMSP